MTHRLRSVWLGVALMAALTAPASVVAMPPDLIDHYKLTANRWGLHQLHPTARRTLVNSLLFGVNPALTLLPTEKMLDAPCDHPPPPADDYVTMKFQQDTTSLVFGLPPNYSLIGDPEFDNECKWWQRHFFPCTVAEPAPLHEQNEGYMHERLECGEDFAYVAATERCVEESETVSLPGMEALPMPAEDAEPTPAFEPANFISGLTPAGTLTNDLNIPIKPAGEELSMPQEDSNTPTDGITCPYLRQQRIDRNACQLADPEMGREVLDNLKRLEEAEKLLELAKEEASLGWMSSALKNCMRIQELCPGSPCAERAFEAMFEWVLGFTEPATAAKKAAEPELKQIEYEWERIWFTDMPSKLTPERIHGGLLPGPDEPSKKPSSEKRTIKKALNQAVSMAYDNAPLRQVFEDLRATSGINIFVDEPALNEKGIGLNQPITVKLDQITLKSALKLLLHSLHLGYVIQDNVLVITTEAEARGKGQPRGHACAEPAIGISEPGVAVQLAGLMKACHLLANQGMYHQAAALAQQAVALDPWLVDADPLIAQMHLLDASMTQPAGEREANEPPTCPYCSMGGKPIHEIVPETKTSAKKATRLTPPLPAVDADVVPALDQVLTESAPTAAQQLAEIICAGIGGPVVDVHSNSEGNVHLSAECCIGGNVYHVRYQNGSLNIWKTTDASNPQP